MYRVALTTVVALLVVSASRIRAQPQVSGFFEYDNITYFENPDPDRINGRNQVILQPEIRDALGPNANIFGSVEVRYDEDDQARNRVFLDEAYANLYLGPVDLRVGSQIYAWGRADGFNPTDFSPRDFSDVLDTDDEKLGLVSAHATYYTGDWSFEAILAPSFRPSVLPGADSRWWAALPPTIENPRFPENGPKLLGVRYDLADEILPDQGLKNVQYATKVTGSSAGWDFSFSWFDGFNDLASLHMSLAIEPPGSTAVVLIEPRYHRRRAVGADAATTVSSVGLHGEAAYYISDDWKGMDPAVNDPYLHYVVGADYTVDDVVSGKDLFLLAEWSHEIQVPDRNTVYRFTDLDHLFRESLFLKSDLNLDDFSKVSLESVLNFATKDWWVRPGASWSFWDGLEFQVRMDLLGGPSDSFFGSTRDNKRVQTRLKYSF